MHVYWITKRIDGYFFGLIVARLALNWIGCFFALKRNNFQNQINANAQQVTVYIMTIGW